MSGKIRSPISEETWSLIGQHPNPDQVKDIDAENKRRRAYFAPVNEQNKKSVGIDADGDEVGLAYIKEDAYTETEVLRNGDLKVTFVYPLDNDYDHSNGRMFVKDIFVYDGKDHLPKKVDREFAWNRRGDKREQWKKWEKEYRGIAKPTKNQFLRFANTVAKTYSRPIDSKTFEILKSVAGNPAYFESVKKLILEEAGLGIKAKDEKSHITVHNNGQIIDVVFAYVLDDGDPDTEGQLFLHDTFTFLATNPREPIGYEREFIVAQGSPSEEGWDEVVQRLTELHKADKPSLKSGEPQKFIKPFLPGILSWKPDIPTILADRATPSEGGYKELTPASYEQAKYRLVAGRSSIASSQAEPEFAKVLPSQQGYYQPLQEALGEDFVLDLDSSNFRYEVEINGDETVVKTHFSFGESELDVLNPGKLTYTEIFRYQGENLKTIERKHDLVGEDDGTLQAMADRIEQFKKEDKFFGPKSLEVQGPTGLNVVLTTFLVPHLAPAPPGFSPLVEDEGLPREIREKAQILEKIRQDLIPFMYHQNFDPVVRGQVLRALTDARYGNDSSLAQNIQAMQDKSTTELEKFKNAAFDDPKLQALEDQKNLGKAIIAIASGQYDHAVEMAGNLHSKQLKEIILQPVDKVIRRKLNLEALEIMRRVALDQVSVREHKSHRWFFGEEYDEKAAAGVINGLFEKAAKASLDSNAKDVFTLLKGLEGLSDLEGKLAGQITRDSLMGRINSVAQTRHKEMQGESYFAIAKGDLHDKGLYASARYLAEFVALHKMPPSRSLEGVEIIEKIANEQLYNERSAIINEKIGTKQEEIQVYTLFAKVKDEIKQMGSENGIELSDAQIVDLQIQGIIKEREDVNDRQGAIAALSTQFQEAVKAQTKIEMDASKIWKLYTEGHLVFEPLIKKGQETLKASEEYQEFEKRLEGMKGIFDKLNTLSEENPNGEFLDLLQGMEGLDEVQGEIRDALLENPMLAKLIAASKTADLAKQWEAYQIVLSAEAEANPQFMPVYEQFLYLAYQKGLPQGQNPRLAFIVQYFKLAGPLQMVGLVTQRIVFSRSDTAGIFSCADCWLSQTMEVERSVILNFS